MAGWRVRGFSLEASVDFLCEELDGWGSLYDALTAGDDVTSIYGSPATKRLLEERARTYHVIAKMLRSMVDDHRTLPVGPDGG